MEKQKKDLKFEEYKGYVLKTAGDLWETWEYKNNPSFNYLSKEDIIQEAFIKLLDILDKIDSKKTDSQKVLFVTTSIKNHVLNTFRNISRQKYMGCIEHNDVDNIETKEVQDESIQKTVVLEFFDRLNKNEQYFISLVLKGFSDEEIMKKIKWTKKTLSEKRLYFKDILQEMINDYKQL